MPVNGVERPTCCYQIDSTTFEVDKRYEIKETMSQGSYGIVCSAIDHEGDETVAVKKIEGIFEHISMAKRTLRELKILRHLQHENLVRIESIFTPADKADMEDIYMVTELMDTDLATTLKSNQALTDEHCKFFLYQLLRGMKYVHSAHVIHRDLKPRNLLVNSDCDLKICDFGLARVCFTDRNWVCPMTEYICTRWYRAPEVLCSWRDYNCAIDMWSIGCIVAELLTRTPIFPGLSTQNQMELIIQFLGPPGASELEKIPNEKCRNFIQTIVVSQRQFPGPCKEHSAEAIDFLDKTLRWDPATRMDINEACQHEYVGELACPEDEPTRDPLDTSDFEFERRKITFAAIREEIWREALLYFPKKTQDGGYTDGESSTDASYNITQFPLLKEGEGQYSSDEDNRSVSTAGCSQECSCIT